MKSNLITLLEKWFFVGVFVLSYFYITYKYTYSFSYWQITADGHYLVLPIVGLLAILLILFSTKKGIKVTVVDLIATIVLIFCLATLVTDVSQYNFHNEAFCNTVILLFFFIIFRVLGIQFIQKIIVPIGLLFFLKEVCKGYVDFYRNIGAEHLSLLIKGNLENSGLYSIYITIHLPLAHYYIAYIVKDKKWQITLLIILYLSVGILVWVTQSRAAMLGMICYFGKLLIDMGKFRQYKKLLIIISSVGIIIALCGLVYFKPASAFGRLIIWKVSLQHISEYFWTGIGKGQFPLFYPKWQIDYFDSLPIAKITETQFADEVFVAYNEPLQILIELGVIGFIILGVIFYQLVFRSNQLVDRLPTHIRNMLFICLVASLFSYPLHVNIILFTVAFGSAFLVPITFKEKALQNRGWGKVLLIGLLLFFVIKSVNVYHSIKQWHRLQNEVFMSYQLRIAAYQKLCPALRHNSKFLLDYGITLYIGKDRFAINILEESKNLLITTATLTTLVHAYEESWNIDKAILAQRALSNFIPYKFRYKDKLLDLYLRKKDKINAKRIASYILSLPIKKDSQTVRNIKNKSSMILTK